MDSRLKRIAPHLFLPLLFLLVALAFSNAVGPFYYAYNYDPDYVYLLNGLNVAILQSPEHVDHPGTPLQLAMGLAIRLANPGVPAPQTAANVIAHAETYLSTASLVILLGYTAAMIRVGIAVTKSTGSYAAGWCVQATPFLLGGNFMALLRVNPEPILLLVSLILVPLLISREEPNLVTLWPRRLLLSFLVATGVCVKITFLPVLLIVLLLERGLANRLKCVALVVVWSLLWTIPIWTKYGRVFNWIWGLAAKEGPYAMGPTGFSGMASLASGLLTLIRANPIFILSLAMGTIALALLRRRTVAERNAVAHWTRLLLCLIVGGVLQLLISTRNPQSRYLVPTAGLMGLTWVGIGVVAIRTGWLSGIRNRPFMVRSAIAFVVLLVSAGSARLYRETVRNAEGRRAMSQVTGGQREGARIFYYGASSPVNALTFATFFSGQQYYRIVEKLVQTGSCQSYLYNNRAGTFYSLRGRVRLEEIIKAGGPVLLQGDVLSEVELKVLPSQVKLREVRQFADERIYEIQWVER